jgi:hypothetical protein
MRGTGNVPQKACGQESKSGRFQECRSWSGGQGMSGRGGETGTAAREGAAAGLADGPTDQAEMQF